jgi:hypothetical protein
MQRSRADNSIPCFPVDLGLLTGIWLMTVRSVGNDSETLHGIIEKGQRQRLETRRVIHTFTHSLVYDDILSLNIVPSIAAKRAETVMFGGSRDLLQRDAASL